MARVGRRPTQDGWEDVEPREPFRPAPAPAPAPAPPAPKPAPAPPKPKPKPAPAPKPAPRPGEVGFVNPDGSVEAEEREAPPVAAAAPPPTAPVPPPPPPPPPAPVAAPTPAPQAYTPPADATVTQAQAFTPPADPQRSALEQSLLDQLTRTANERDKFNAAVRDRIMQQLEALPQGAPSIEDADLAPQQAAFSSAARKAEQRNRAAMAERMAAQGNLDSGAFDSVVERGGMNTQSLEAANAAQLVGERSRQRLAELQTIMQMGAGVMSADQQQELQRQMALLDAEIRRNSFQGDLSLRKTLGGGQMQLGLLDLLTKNQQFNDQLGFDIGAFANNAARDAFLGMMG